MSTAGTESKSFSAYQSVLEQAPINIMVANLELEIIYLNQASKDTLLKLAEYLPCKPHQVLGSNIDIFHKDPSYQRGLLASDSELPRRATIQIGPEFASLLVSPVFDANKKYLGPMLSWEVITEQVKQAEEQTRLASMVKNAPINIIMADSDGIVNYMNPASIETLESLAQYLPIPVDKIVGSSIDVFHKNPAYQQGIIGDPKNLPHTAKIPVGPETLDLLVSAIHNNQGEYLGPMLTWSVITKEEKLAVEQARLTAMVENAPINIVMADTKGMITYMNPASTKTLESLAQYLPIPVAQIVGSSFDVFHKNPSYQQGIIADPNNLPHTAKIPVGPETLDLLVSAIHDNQGEYLGPMLTWSVITKEEKLATEQARLTAMVENAPVNIIMADTKGMITYMNPASTKTLGGLTEYLPVPINDIVGGSFDVFHKNPSYQQGIIADPKNLPHNAKIMVGPETLDLLVSAIHDNQGEYLGPMLTWSVVTDRVKMSEALSETSAVLSSSATSLTETSETMAASAEQTKTQITQVTADVEQSNTTITTVASSVEMMVTSINEISTNVQNADRITKEAVEKAEGTSATINKLGESSQQIGKVVKLITTIAQQTNLLALNATIEAARAGEAGKGFAVVANEVKELAKKTATATDEIAEQVEGIQADSKEAVGAIKSISETIAQISEISVLVAGATEEQSSVTGEINRNIQSVTQASKGIQENVSSVSQAATESGEKAFGMQKNVADLNDLSIKLQDLLKSYKV